MIEALVFFLIIVAFGVALKRPGGYEDSVSQQILQQRAEGHQDEAEKIFAGNSCLLVMIGIVIVVVGLTMIASVLAEGG